MFDRADVSRNGLLFSACGPSGLPTLSTASGLLWAALELPPEHAVRPLKAVMATSAATMERLTRIGSSWSSTTGVLSTGSEPRPPATERRPEVNPGDSGHVNNTAVTFCT